MKIITNAPILLKGKNGDEQYSQGTQNGYAEGDANYSDYIFTQKESGYYSIEGELYHFDGQENTFSSVEGFVPISVAGNSIISENSDDFFNAEGDIEQVYLGADGEEYYSADGETFYNAKGEKIKGAFKKVGKGIGGGAKKVGGGIGKGAKAVGGGFKKAGSWVGKQFQKFKKFVGKLKPKSKDARALKKLERGKKRTEKKENKKLTKETEAIYKKEKAEFDRKVKERDLLEKKNAEEKAKGLNPPPLPPPPIPPIMPTDDSGTPSAGAEKYIDVLPPVVNGEKTLPDGSKVAVPNDQTAQGQDGKTYDKKDLEGTGDTQVITNEETGEKELVKIIDAKDVTTLPTEDGEGVPFKSTDVSEGGEKKGMSKGMKIGLIVGGSLIVLGIVGYLIYRSRNKGNKGK